MELTVYPGRALRGKVALPGDKSISHRSALFAALAPGRSRIQNFLDAGVTRVMLEALDQLGVRCRLDTQVPGSSPELVVEGTGLHDLKPPREPLDCGHSGTTIRFLAGALAAAGIPAELDGSTGLRKRPMGRIVDPLQKMAVPITAAAGGVAPLRLEKRADSQRLRAIDYVLPVASAQVKTALILAALDADGAVSLTEPGRSRDHTERMLSAMGARIRVGKHPESPGHVTVTVEPLEAPLSPLDLSIPGDISSAAFLLVAALITPGSKITLLEVGINPTRAGLLDALQRMGGKIAVENTRHVGGEPVADIRAETSALHGIDVQGELVIRMIDEFPIFGVAAAFAEGTTRVSDASELRLKESDRIQVLVDRLNRLGAQVEERADGFVVQGARPEGGVSVDPARDHRLAMSLAVAGLAAAEPVVVSNAGIIEQSYPGFSSALQRLGADLTAV